MKILLAGDVGGTKTDLQLVARSKSGGLDTLAQARYESARFAGLTEIVRSFLASSPAGHPCAACFAVAGPVAEQRSTLTNLPWQLDARDLESELAIPRVELINDFVAVAHGCVRLPRSQLSTLRDVPRRADAPRAVIGAGTGIGEAFLVPTGDDFTVCPTEGGHVDFAPRTEVEDRLLAHLRQSLERVSVERVVSGTGIVAIYRFLCEPLHGAGTSEILEAVNGLADPSTGATPADAAAAISDAALSGSDPVAVETMRVFVSAYGAEAGNLALKTLPFGGLYIAGGIAPKILPLLQEGTFTGAFLDKGRMRPQMERVPVHVVLNPEVGLLGAAWRAARMMETGGR